MRILNIDVDIEYDNTLLSPAEVVYNVRQALDEYFNRFEAEYGEEEALKIVGVYTHEESSVVSGRDKS